MLDVVTALPTSSAVSERKRLHDLANLLTGLMAAVEDLRRDLEEIRDAPDQASERVVRSLESARFIDEASQMVSKLLFGPDTLAPSPPSHAEVAHCVDLAVRSARLPEGLVQLDIGAVGPVACPPDAVTRVVLNLVLNAVAALPETPVLGSVCVSVFESASGWVTIEVTDRGRGMSVEERDLAFEIGFSRSPGGSGLGLSICRNLLSAHGGQIALLDNPSGGTTARVRLLQASVPRLL